MKKSELIDMLLSNDEEEVLIMIGEVEYEIDPEVVHLLESFDGFCTSIPPALGLKTKEI